MDRTAAAAVDIYAGSCNPKKKGKKKEKRKKEKEKKEEKGNTRVSPPVAGRAAVGLSATSNQGGSPDGA